MNTIKKVALSNLRTSSQHRAWSLEAQAQQISAQSAEQFFLNIQCLRPNFGRKALINRF